MESYCHSLKAELTHQRSFASDAELNASVAGYINRFYNEKRIQCRGTTSLEKRSD